MLLEDDSPGPTAETELLLYLADRDGSTGPADKGVAVIRRFTLATGAPVLSSCLANFDCRVVDSMAAATHSIFIGKVEAIALEPGDASFRMALAISYERMGKKADAAGN